MKSQGIFTFIRSLKRLLAGKPNIPASLQDNPLLQKILQRRSVRSFQDKDIPEDYFAAILEAARLAPSAVNLQPWSFVIFDRATWQGTFERKIPFNAARAVIVIADTYRVKQVLNVFPYSPLVEYTLGVMNASLAAMNMNIAAEALGIASVMLSETGRSGFLDASYLKEKLRLPQETMPLMSIVFGYAKGSYLPMPPKLPSEMIFFSKQYPLPNQEQMQDWLEQMIAGYKASYPLSSFEKQLAIYQNKIAQAEAELTKTIFYHS